MNNVRRGTDRGRTFVMHIHTQYHSTLNIRDRQDRACYRVLDVSLFRKKSILKVVTFLKGLLFSFT